MNTAIITAPPQPPPIAGVPVPTINPVGVPVSEPTVTTATVFTVNPVTEPTPTLLRAEVPAKFSKYSQVAQAAICDGLTATLVLRGNIRAYKVAMGRALRTLKEECSKPGCGNYTTEVLPLFDTRYQTADAWIELANKADARTLGNLPAGAGDYYSLDSLPDPTPNGKKTRLTARRNPDPTAMTIRVKGLGDEKAKLKAYKAKHAVGYEKVFQEVVRLLPIAGHGAVLAALAQTVTAMGTNAGK